MSHIVTIQTKARDPAAVMAACQRLGLPAPIDDRKYVRRRENRQRPGCRQTSVTDHQHHQRSDQGADTGGSGLGNADHERGKRSQKPLPQCQIWHEGMARVPELCRFLDLTALDAVGAHSHALGGTLDRGADLLQVNIPAPLGHIIGVADAVAEPRPTTAHFTYLRHMMSRVTQARTPDGVSSNLLPEQLNEPVQGDKGNQEHSRKQQHPLPRLKFQVPTIGFPRH